MARPNHLVFESDVSGELFVRSTRHAKRTGHARTVLSTGRWPHGETLGTSDACCIATHIRRGAPRTWKVTH